MKNLILTTSLIISSFSLFGQEAKVTTDQEVYKFDEIIEVTFELNAKYDSLHLPEFEGFKLISGPTKHSSVSIQNGEQTVSESRTYKLRPVKSGNLKISSPTYFIDGQIIDGEPAKVEVDPSELTSEELEEKKFQDFIEDGIKPEGTVRVIFHDTMGYVETFGEMGWQFERRLTAEEISQIKKIE